MSAALAVVVPNLYSHSLCDCKIRIYSSVGLFSITNFLKIFFSSFFEEYEIQGRFWGEQEFGLR